MFIILFEGMNKPTFIMKIILKELQLQTFSTIFKLYNRHDMNFFPLKAWPMLWGWIVSFLFFKCYFTFLFYPSESHTAKISNMQFRSRWKNHNIFWYVKYQNISRLSHSSCCFSEGFTTKKWGNWYACLRDSVDIKQWMVNLNH